LIKRIFLLLFLVFLFNLSLWASIPAEDDSYRNFKNLVKENKIETGRKSAQSFINQYPDSNYLPEVKFFLAESESDSYRALKQYERIIKDYPQSGFACLSQGRIARHYFTFGNFRQAKLAWQKYLKLFPQGEEAETAFLSIGSCDYEEKRFNKAIDSFEEFISLYPRSRLIPQARFNLASAYLNRGKIDQAEKELESLLKDYPRWENKAGIYQSLSEVYLEKGERDKSKKILDRLKEEFPQSLDLEKKKGKDIFSPENYQGKTYAVQVGAFSTKKRAERLVARLRRKGYQVYLVSAEKDGVTFYRVRIGDFPDEEAAGVMVEKIETQENLPGMVVSGK